MVGVAWRARSISRLGRFPDHADPVVDYQKHSDWVDLLRGQEKPCRTGRALRVESYGNSVECDQRTHNSHKQSLGEFSGDRKELKTWAVDRESVVGTVRGLVADMLGREDVEG